MHETLVIFKKDVRRLWWQIGAMVAISVVVGCLDAGRAAAHPRVVEGLLSVLLPLVWALLIAQAIHGEALVGDREFWMTRPYRWGRLLGAKALFVAAVVHLPSLVTDAAILAARGYNPLVWFPELLLKQLLLAAGFTLPAMALAVLVNNLTQFVVGVPLLYVSLTASSGFRQSPLVLVGSSGATHVAIALLSVVAAGVVVLQYWQRRTGLARMVAVAAVLVLGVGTPLSAYYWNIPALHVVEFPTADVHATMTLAAPDPLAVHGRITGRVFTTLPFRVTGLAEHDLAWMTSVSMEIDAANGVHYRYDPPRADFDIGMSGMSDGSTSLFLGMKSEAYERIKDSKVTIAGTVGFVVHEKGQEVRMPVGASRQVAAWMHCSTALEEPLYYGPRVSVLCDTPGAYGALADVRLDEKLVHWWQIDQRRTVWIGASVVSLSPLRWRQYSFQVGATPDRSSMEAPVIIAPERLTGYSTVSFKATDVDLREYSK